MDFYLLIKNKLPATHTLGFFALQICYRAVMIWDLILKGKITLVMQHKMKYCLKGQLHWEEEEREFKQAQYFFFFISLGITKGRENFSNKSCAKQE